MVPNAPFLYPLKTTENHKVFWFFQGVEKWCIKNEWVKSNLKVAVSKMLTNYSEVIWEATIKQRIYLFLPEKRHRNTRIAPSKKTHQSYDDFERTMHFCVKTKYMDSFYKKKFFNLLCCYKTGKSWKFDHGRMNEFC